jgi:hypothetical protein
MSHDKRRSYRLPVQEEYTKATIVATAKEWPATLVNESAGGFLIATSPKAELTPGQTVTVKLYSGSYLVEIVHTKLDDGKLQLGARRFDDELQPRPRVSVYRGLGKGGMQSPPRSLHGMLFLGAYGAIAVLAAVLVLQGGRGGLAQTLLGNDGANSRASTFSSLPTNFSAAIDWRRIQSLHGLNSLTSDQVRSAIGLTENQQKSLDRVFGDTARKLRNLYAEDQAQPADEVSRQSSEVIDQAVQRILCTLTDRQIELWRQELILAAAAPRDE